MGLTWVRRRGESGSGAAAARQRADERLERLSDAASALAAAAAACAVDALRGAREGGGRSSVCVQAFLIAELENVSIATIFR